uniref:WH1 domain-containing protein n=1 Tax=Panagrellus redivivus TaxID=6233 RepID=A0A7E4W8I5_PANRE
MNTVIHSIRSHFKSLNRKPHFCSSHVLANATIDVLLYDNAARTWVTPEGGEFGNLKTPGQAVVQLLQDESGFRIIASRRIDNSMLLNQLIYENFHYKAATPTFHQWKSEMKQVYGLNFPYPEQASIFLESVERSVSAVNAGLTQPTYQSINNASNGVYQEPQMYAEPQHHIQQQQPQQVQRRDIDQESIGSANGHPMGYRGKSSYSSLNGAPPSVAANNQLQQQQRRCSNGSSGSSGQSSSTNIYATSNGNVNGYHPQSAAPQGPAPVPQSNGVTRIPVPPPAPPPLTPAASASVSKGAPISSNAPPPPPPPPGNLFKSGGPKGAPSMADELKAKQNRLRKVSSATDTQAASASTSTPTPKVSISGGGGNALMDELSRRLEMNKAQANNKADAVSTSSSSGFSSSSVGAATTSDTSDSGATLTSTRRPNGDAPKPWSKTNGISSNNVSTDSPKALRKTNGTTDTNVGITTADLERLKIEILAEVTQQINAAKQEILNAILAQR